jgi:dienelactone hydrolase
MRYWAIPLLVGLVAIAAFHAVAATDAESANREFIASLTLRSEQIIADSTHPLILWLGQTSPVAYRSAAPVTLKLTLAPAAANSPVIKELGTFDVLPRDLNARPLGVSAQLDGVADGNYRIVAMVFEGDATIATLEQSVWLVKGIDAKRGDIVERLTRISGHESTKATILYPFDLARVVNIGRRGYNAADLGINEASEPNYFDFAGGLKHSEELLAALEAGHDPLWQARGDTKRHYYFAEADEIMPYHVYVPPTWDGKTPLPMVFILHGNTRNQDFYFERDKQIIPKLAEKHGFMLVGVFGYHPNGGYNLNSMTGRGGGTGLGAFGPATMPTAAGGAARGPATAEFMGGMPTSRLGQLSETDTMNVFDLVTKEYPIDPKRIFLFGYSAGGNGGYYIAGKYADHWAAVALGGAALRLTNTYPYYDKLKSLKVPFFIYYGEKDTVGPGAISSVQTLHDRGLSATLKSYPNVTHDGGPAAGASDAFDFFNANGRK